jgi:hypothetical protein
MPYRSLAQERWGHTPEGQKALGGPAAVHEWDSATKGKHLPERVNSYANGGLVVANKGYQSKDEGFAKGGAVLGKNSEFLKTEDRFRGVPNPKVVKTDDDYEKTGGAGGKCAKVKGETKVLKTVKPAK